MDSAAVAARINALLDEKGWTARELGRRAGFGDSSVASNTLKRLSEGKGAALKTLRASRGLGVLAAARSHVPTPLWAAEYRAPILQRLLDADRF